MREPGCRRGRGAARMDAATHAPTRTPRSPPIAASSPFRPALLVVSGNLLEMYDFTVYGYYAGAIAKAYFPAADT